jgi:DNA polymerase I-like protein with 3'-5' exonuclease and polymerase domains
MIHYISQEGDLKDVYEYKFFRDQLLRAAEFSEKLKSRIPTLNYEVLPDPNSYIKNLIKDNSRDVVVIDTESRGLNYFLDELVSIQFATDDSKGYFCWMKDIDKELLIELFNTNKKFVMHNGIYDCIVLNVNGIHNVRCDFDTMLVSHSLNENSPNGLKPNTWLYTQYGGYEREIAEYRAKFEVGDFVDIPEKLLVKYGCYDVLMTFKLYNYFLKRLDLEDVDVKNNYYNYIIPAIPMMVDLHLEGIPIDMNYLKNYNISLVSTQKELISKIIDILGEGIDLNSNKQLSIALQKLPNFEILKSDKGEKLLTKTGDLVLNKDTLKSYGKNGFEVALLIQEYNHVTKEINQLGIEHYKKTGEKKGFILSIHNGRLYGSYKLHGTAAGRASGGEDKENKESLTASKTFGINPQNVPAKDAFRKLFLAPGLKLQDQVI